MISVCIPCTARHIKYLPECIKSIELQTLLPDEIVIGASEVTPVHKKYLQRLTSSIPIKIAHVSNAQYAGPNRNMAIAAASGDIILMIDADDLMCAGRVAITAEFFAEFPRALLLMAYYTTADESPQAFSIAYCDKYRYDNRIHFGHPAFRRELFAEVQYGDRKRGQDVQFVQDVIDRYIHRTYTYKRPLTVYRQKYSSLNR
jgi:glycosyltransferase involved in cell wall biosynthesis